MTKFLGIVLIAIIVTIDNALLTGLILPAFSRAQKRFVLMIVGMLLGGSQILLAVSVDQLLNHLLFRIIAIVLLGWMCIRTLGIQATRRPLSWVMIAKLWIYTVFGNLDNMIWLGSELKGDRFWLIVSSIGTIPLFVVVALFLSSQTEKQQWILPLGAGMMAWAAASLALDIPLCKDFINSLDDAPRTTFQCFITIGILLIGFGVRKFILSHSNEKI